MLEKEEYLILRHALSFYDFLIGPDERLKNVDISKGLEIIKKIDEYEELDEDPEEQLWVLYQDEFREYLDRNRQRR